MEACRVSWDYSCYLTYFQKTSSKGDGVVTGFLFVCFVF